MNELVTVFTCCGEPTIGILHEAAGSSTLAVIVVGGPQYRVGSHRQFVVMARHLAGRGISTFRFDLRGMGDAEGESITFEEAGPDIRAAIDHARTCMNATRIVLIGLCDGATAAGMYVDQDDRVSDLVLINPWVHTEAAGTQARLKHYYLRRVTQVGFWRKLFSGRFNWSDSISSFRGVLSKWALSAEPVPASYVDRLREGLTRFAGRTCVVLSGKDITAREFEELTRSDRSWGRLSRSWSWIRLESADHTFSGPGSTEEAAREIAEWIAAADSSRSKATAGARD